MKKNTVLISIIAVLVVAAAVIGVVLISGSSKTIKGTADGCPYEYTIKCKKDTLTICLNGDFEADSWSSEFSSNSYKVDQKKNGKSKAEFEITGLFEGLSTITFKKGITEELVITTEYADNCISVRSEEYSKNAELEKASEILNSLEGENGTVVLDESFMEELQKRMSGDDSDN